MRVQNNAKQGLRKHVICGVMKRLVLEEHPWSCAEAKRLNHRNPSKTKLFMERGVFDSVKAIFCMEYEARQRGVHVHHQVYRHVGERKIAVAPVDRVDFETRKVGRDCVKMMTVFQFYDCHYIA